MDPVDRAIEATAKRTFNMTRAEHKLTTGRPFAVMIPQDFTDQELVEAMAWLTLEGWPLVIANRVQRPSIVLATGPLPPSGN